MFGHHGREECVPNSSDPLFADAVSGRRKLQSVTNFQPGTSKHFEAKRKRKSIATSGTRSDTRIPLVAH